MTPAHSQGVHEGPTRADSLPATGVQRETAQGGAGSKIPGTGLSTDMVLEQVHDWIARSALLPSDPGAQRLAAMLSDPDGLRFALAFIDGVIRPEDVHVAAAELRRLAHRPPRFLAAHLRGAIRAGALAGTLAPGLAVPMARLALRRIVSHLVIDASDRRLSEAIAHLRADGTRLNLNLLGEAVLGRREADRRLKRTRALLERADVDYVSIKVSAAVPPHSPWAFDQAVEEIQTRLLPLFELAAQRGKFINLDMEEYRDLDLTVAVFTGLMEREQLLSLEAGIVLQAYLPDALGALMHLEQWAAARRARGGAAIKVRLVKGANLPMERVEAELHGWPLASWLSKRESDTNYKRLVVYALTPERVHSVRIGVASHNLFDVALAWLLADQRGVHDAVEFEMLLGMASAQARAVAQTVGPLRLYTPVVHPAEFDVAIAYLMRRLDELASGENYLSAAFSLADDPTLLERETERFRESVAALDDAVPAPRRNQDRRIGAAIGGSGTAPVQAGGPLPQDFHNAPDSDPSTPGNRTWAREIIARVADSTLGSEQAEAAQITGREQLEEMLARTLDAAGAWGALPATERATILRRAAVQLERRRGELIEVMASECGKTFDQGDPEVSEAVDFAAYYAQQAEALEQIDGAAHVPVSLSLAVPPWNFPVSIPAGSVLGPLAAGSAVVFKPAPQARRCGAVLAEALWDAGIPRDVLRYVNVEENELGRALISDPRVQRVVLTGAYDTAALFRSWRPDLPLLGETSGKNAIIVTPSADPDLAVHDLVTSAFSHAGQKCSAASLGILVGSVAGSGRFRRQLIDAVSSLRVADPSDPRAQLGPLIEPPSGKLEHALTTLAPGESWLIQPRQLDDGGRLWSPGVRTGVARGSDFHMIEYFGPVLGLIAARDLDEAIAIQNEVPFGLTAGIHSLDRSEIEHWLEHAQAGNLYVNRGITGAIVRRQPFGGWKRSTVGTGTKAGGPNYLIGLSDWRSAPSLAGSPLGPLAKRALEAAQRSGLDLEPLARALRSDAAAMSDEFAMGRDVSGLRLEHNILRYLPVPVEIRSATGNPAELLRVTAAGKLAGTVGGAAVDSQRGAGTGRSRDVGGGAAHPHRARLTISGRQPHRARLTISGTQPHRAPLAISTARPLPDALSELFAAWQIPVVVESQQTWAATLATRPDGRIRLIGGNAAEAMQAGGGRPDVAIHAQPVTESGRLELLPFLHEQAISICAHRFGTPV